jgi:hypothetical protein
MRNETRITKPDWCLRADQWCLGLCLPSPFSPSLSLSLSTASSSSSALEQAHLVRQVRVPTPSPCIALLRWSGVWTSHRRAPSAPATWGEAASPAAAPAAAAPASASDDAIATVS